jgi:hypothetical protein
LILYYLSKGSSPENCDWSRNKVWVFCALKHLRKYVQFKIFKLYLKQISQQGLIPQIKQKCVIQKVLTSKQKDKKCAKQVVPKVFSCSHSMQMCAKHLLQLLRLQRTLKFTSSFIAERDNRNAKRKPCTFLSRKSFDI